MGCFNSGENAEVFDAALYPSCWYYDVSMNRRQYSTWNCREEGVA